LPATAPLNPQEESQDVRLVDCYVGRGLQDAEETSNVLHVVIAKIWPVGNITINCMFERKE
jgi:hypothetical protein